MSIMDSLKRGAQYIKDKLQGRKVPKGNLLDAVLRATSRYPRMLHVSKAIVHVPELHAAGLVPFPYIVNPGKGVTFSIGANRLKRHADAGTNNKERRRLRTALKRRHRALIEQDEQARRYA